MSMDALLKADEQKFVSVPVYFSQFLKCAKAARAENETFTSKRSALENLESIGVPSSTSSLLIDSIDVSDIRSLVPNSEMDAGMERSQLVSQKFMQAENSRRRNAQYKSIALRALKYDHIDSKALARHSPYYYDESENEGEEETENSDSVDEYSDLLVSTSIYYGYSRELEYHEIRLGRLLKVTDRIELTGSHTLQDLKNSFSCPSDFVFTEDFSLKEPTVDDFSKNKFPSAMFFIHDTFYIEKNSDPNLEDPSFQIRNWAQYRPNIGPFNVKYMNEQKIGELTARLGQPYVYIHQGICEHLIVFNDLSLKDEFHKDVKFPRRLVERNFRRIACHTCKEHYAKWTISEHEDLLPSSPAFLCNECYREYCFTADNEKICDFIAIPYCDRKEVGECGKFISELRF